MTSRLEQIAYDRWKAWGAYAKYTYCGACKTMRYCRSAYPSGPFLCVDCHDQR